MDNNTLKDNSQTNTPAPEATLAPTEPASPTPTASTIPTPAGDTSLPNNEATPVSTEPDATPLVDLTPAPNTQAEAAPAPETPNIQAAEQPANTPAPTEPVPINDVEEAPPANPIPLVDASAAVASKPTPTGTTEQSTTANPAIATTPIIGDEISTKRSPILNSAPIKTQKFDLKYIIPIAVLGVLVLGLGGFLLYDKLVGQPQALEAARKAAAAAAAPVISNDVDVNTDNNSDTPSPITYSSSNSLNGTGTYILTSIDNAPGVSVIGNDASTVAEFTIDWAKAKEAYSDIKTTSGTSTYTIDFGQGISEIFYGRIDKDGFYFFLLDDGNIDYLDIHQALANKSFTATGPIDGVENVIKFLDATSNGVNTVLAQQSTSEYYDLSTFLK